MNELYELREKLCKELKRYNNEDITTSNLEVIDKLSHATKNIDKIIEKYEEEEGYSSYDNSYRGRSNRGNSYARGRGRNARRDSMGRYASSNGSYENGYSRNGDIASELRELMLEAPDEQTRMEYQKVINKLEQMM